MKHAARLPGPFVSQTRGVQGPFVSQTRGVWGRAEGRADVVGMGTARMASRSVIATTWWRVAASTPSAARVKS